MTAARCSIPLLTVRGDRSGTITGELPWMLDIARRQTMRKTGGMSTHQKAAHKVGEVRVSRAQIADLLELSRSHKTQERLLASTFLCPCHVKARIPVVWEALYRLMTDADPRVRLAAWHTLEDGGLPSDRTIFARLEELFTKETDP